MKKELAVFLAVFVLAVMASPVFGEQPTKEEKLKHADKNKDGHVDKKEMRMEKKWEHKHEAKREAKLEREKVNTWWEKKADTNGDGVVDSNEHAAWKQLEKERIDLNNDGVIDAKERRLCWRHARAKVNTPIEAKYDVNGDGWLEPDEVREMLKDRYALIKTHGQAKVDTEIEKGYDANDDGILDATEAEAMNEDSQ